MTFIGWGFVFLEWDATTLLVFFVFLVILVCYGCYGIWGSCVQSIASLKFIEVVYLLLGLVRNRNCLVLARIFLLSRHWLDIGVMIPGTYQAELGGWAFAADE